MLQSAGPSAGKAMEFDPAVVERLHASLQGIPRRPPGSARLLLVLLCAHWRPALVGEMEAKVNMFMLLAVFCALWRQGLVIEISAEADILHAI